MKWIIEKVSVQTQTITNKHCGYWSVNNFGQCEYPEHVLLAYLQLSGSI